MGVMGDPSGLLSQWAQIQDKDFYIPFWGMALGKSLDLCVDRKHRPLWGLLRAMDVYLCTLQDFP